MCIYKNKYPIYHMIYDIFTRSPREKYLTTKSV